jgi:hypothetical protein
MPEGTEWAATLVENKTGMKLWMSTDLYGQNAVSRVELITRLPDSNGVVSGYDVTRYQEQHNWKMTAALQRFVNGDINKVGREVRAKLLNAGYREYLRTIQARMAERADDQDNLTRVMVGQMAARASVTLPRRREGEKVGQNGYIRAGETSGDFRLDGSGQKVWELNLRDLTLDQLQAILDVVEKG